MPIVKTGHHSCSLSWPNFCNPIFSTLQIYRCDHLRVVLVSPPMSKRITCLETWSNDHVLVACGSDILEWRRLECMGKVGSHPGTVRMLGLLMDWAGSLAQITIPLWEGCEGVPWSIRIKAAPWVATTGADG